MRMGDVELVLGSCANREGENMARYPLDQDPDGVNPEPMPSGVVPVAPDGGGGRKL